MNIKVIILSGIMSALIGLMIAFSVASIAKREVRKPVILIAGSSLGFVIGAFQAAVRQQRDARESDYTESDE